MNIHVRWQKPQGWTYVVYPLGGADAIPVAGHHALVEPRTVMPDAQGLLSHLLPGFVDTDPGAVAAKKELIVKTLKTHYPTAAIQFSPPPA